MKKVAIVFVLAVFVPSLVLAWLAVRSSRDQQFVLERQQSALLQRVADELSRQVNATLATLQRDFAGQIEEMLRITSADETAAKFDQRVRESWPLAEVGFVVTMDGSILSPSLFGRADARRFRLENERFLTSRETVEVYWESPKGPINLSKLDRAKDTTTPDTKTKDPGAGEKSVFATKAGKLPAPPPSQGTNPAAPAEASEGAEFRHLVGTATEGTLARFLQDKLKLLFWYRPARDPQMIFGAQVDLHRLVAKLATLVQVEPALRNEIALVLLDDAGRPAAASRPGFRTDWKQPFVSADIGEVLPHWQAAVYLINPTQLNRSARTFSLLVGLLIGLLLLAIGVGGWLIVADLKRQLTLARQKTDFVSNVSHELKTPLTSIRMFSELLAEGRIHDDAKRRHYLQIIAAETARLTRLINNVLDFARLEGGEKKYHFQELDFVRVVRETVDTYRPPLEEGGFQFTCRWPDNPVWVRGDRDALAQVLVNLLSNAEKYSGEHKEIGVELQVAPRPPATVEARVLDRGLGIPRGCEEKIFEQFYRAHDALGSGIQGTGLGLTLARQIAQVHGGTLTFEPRTGGGSCFVLRLPLSTAELSHDSPVQTTGGER